MSQSQNNLGTTKNPNDAPERTKTPVAGGGTGSEATLGAADGETEADDRGTAVRWHSYTRRLLHYLSSKFNAFVFEIISRSQLLNITIKVLSEHFSKFTGAFDRVRESFAEKMQQIVSFFSTSREQIQEVDGNFSKIADSFEKSFQIGTSLQEEVKAAGERLDVVQDLAEQTNVLALNASIQAARVGHAGAAFAVVASEVRKHGIESQEVVEQAAQRLKNVTGLVIELVGLMNNINDSVSRGKELLKGLLDNVEREKHSVGSVQSDLEELLGAFQEYDALRETLERMIHQSSVSNSEIEEMLLSFQGDLAGSSDIPPDAVK